MAKPVAGLSGGFTPVSKELSMAVLALREIRNLTRELPNLPDCALRSSVASVIEAMKHGEVDDLKYFIDLDLQNHLINQQKKQIADLELKIKQLVREKGPTSFQVQDSISEVEALDIASDTIQRIKVRRFWLGFFVGSACVISVVVVTIYSLLREPSIPNDGPSPSLNRQHIRKEH